MRPNPFPVWALAVTAVAIIIITAPAPFTIAGNGCPGPRPDDRTDCRTAASANGATDERPSGSADYGAAKCILSRRLLSRHRQPQSQQRRNSQISKHSVILRSMDSACSHPHCGTSLRQVNGQNRPTARQRVHTARMVVCVAQFEGIYLDLFRRDRPEQLDCMSNTACTVQPRHSDVNCPAELNLAGFNKTNPGLCFELAVAAMQQPRLRQSGAGIVCCIEWLSSHRHA